MKLGIFRANCSIDVLTIITVFLSVLMCDFSIAQTKYQSHKINIGDFECTIINDGDMFNGNADNILNGASPDQLNEMLKKYDLDPERIPYSNSCLVVKTDDHLILIDAGIGMDIAERNEGKSTGLLIPALTEQGYDLKDFDMVLISHWHYDHIGGLSDDSGKPYFPNAKHYFMKCDWDRGMSQSKGYEDKLKSVKDLVSFLEGDSELVPGITIISAPGHTEGHFFVKIHSKNEELLYISDLIIHPVNVECPEFVLSHAFNKGQAIATRTKTYRDAAENNTLLLSFHVIFPGLGY
ncbi:MAG: MBL fold metallo-hydrolase, partial [bacterium]|nr:MBL fold metallo-hydrolase [bacterium]